MFFPTEVSPSVRISAEATDSEVCTSNTVHPSGLSDSSDMISAILDDPSPTDVSPAVIVSNSTEARDSQACMLSTMHPSGLLDFSDILLSASSSMNDILKRNISRYNGF